MQLSEVWKIMVGTCGPYNSGGSATSTAVKCNDFFSLVLSQVHKTKVGGKSIWWSYIKTWKDVSVPSLYIRKPSLTTQWRAIAGYPFFHQISANLSVRCQSKGIYSFDILWPISQNLGQAKSLQRCHLWHKYVRLQHVIHQASVTSLLEHTRW
jgi:hypothetical protein